MPMKRVISCVLCLVMLAAFLPILPARATIDTITINYGKPEKLSDPTTHQLTNALQISTEYDGKLWVDKSVSATGEICENIEKNLADDEFEVSLSALSQTYPIETITTETQKKANVVMVVDVSTSMTSNYMTENGTTKTRMAILKEVGQNFIELLANLGEDFTINLSIVVYAGQGFITQIWTPLTADTKDALKSKIANIAIPTTATCVGATSNSNTNSQSGAYMARMLYSDENATVLNRPANYRETATNNFIVFMTDGAPNRYYTAGTAQLGVIDSTENPGSIPVKYDATHNIYYTVPNGITRNITSTDYKRQAANKLLEQAEAMRTIHNPTVFSLALGEWFVEEGEYSGFPTATYLCQLFAGVANGTRSSATGEVLTADYAYQTYLGKDVPDGAMPGNSPTFPDLTKSGGDNGENFKNGQRYQYTISNGNTHYFNTIQDLIDAMNLPNPTDTFTDAVSGQLVQKQTAFYNQVNVATAEDARFKSLSGDGVDSCGIQGLPAELVTQIAYYYAGNTATKFSTAMADIVTTISTSFANYTTSTVATEDPNADGLITFYDHMGEGMQMREFLGVEFNEQIYTGANFARRILLTESWTAEEEALLSKWCKSFSIVYAAEFNLQSLSTLIARCKAGGSLYYNSDTDFDNRLVWYAQYIPATGNFIYLCPYYNADGTVATPPDSATHAIFQYMVFDEVDATTLIADEASLMYLHMENVVELSTGKETVIFRIPAALIPVRAVLTTDGIARLIHDADPISMLFTVGMRGDVSPTLLDRHLSEDENGERIYTFYTNAWKEQTELLQDDYGTTRAIFTASKLNPYYQAQQDEPLYVADAAAPDGYRQATAADSGTLYLFIQWNDISGAHQEYRPASDYYDVTAATELTGETGTFLYIPKNTLRCNTRIELMQAKASDNPTQTNAYSYQASFALDNRDETVVRARLGNNGKLILGEINFSDYVVVDYGLPVHIAPEGIELIPTNDELAVFASEWGTGTYGLGDLELSHGTVSLVNTQLLYLPETTNFSGIDTADLRGVARLDDPQTPEHTKRTAVCSGSIHIIPASNITYEENFLSFTDAAGVGDAAGAAWSATGTQTPNAQQSNTNILYGYDEAYAQNAALSDSLGNAMVATVTNPNVQPTAEFTFTGTGFDLLSRTGADSGVMLVEVRAGSASGALEKVLIVDTYLNGETLYQLPVVHYNCTAYGTYHVKVIAYYNKAFDHQITARAAMTDEQLRTLLGYSAETPLELFKAAEQTEKAATRAPATAVEGQYKVYVDGIRVYNPLGQTLTADNSIPYNAYRMANELNPTYAQIREHLLGSTNWSDTTATTIGGAVYIAGTGSDAGPGELASHTGIYLGSSGRVKTETTDTQEEVLLDAENNRMTFLVDETEYELYYYSGALTRTETDGKVVYTDANGVVAETRIYYHLPDPPVEGEEQTYTTVYLTRDEERTLQLCFYDDVYATEGPQNEVYLRNGQAIAFTVGAGDYVQLSAKSPNGKTVELCLFDTVQGNWVQVSSIASSTEQFFDVTPYIHNGTVIVKCTAAEADAILSLVHAKLTNDVGEPSRMSSDLNLIYTAQRALAVNATIVPDHIHTFTAETVREATCTQDGVGKKVCACGETEEYTIPATGHQETYEVTVPATCTASGIGVSTCSVCGETRTQTIAALGHDYFTAEVIRQADGENDALILCTCARCGFEYLLTGEIAYSRVTTDFTDIPENWAKEGITYVIAQSLMNGTSAGVFSRRRRRCPAPCWSPCSTAWTASAAAPVCIPLPMSRRISITATRQAGLMTKALSTA